MPHPPIAADCQAVLNDTGHAAVDTAKLRDQPYQDQALEYLQQVAFDTKRRKRRQQAAGLAASVPDLALARTSPTIGQGSAPEPDPLGLKPPPLPGGSVAGFRKRDTRFVPVRDSLKKSECFKTTPGAKTPPVPGRSVSKGPLARGRAATAGSKMVKALGPPPSEWTTLGGADLSGNTSKLERDTGDEAAAAVACAAKLCPEGLEGTMLSLLAQNCSASAPLLRPTPSSPKNSTSSSLQASSKGSSAMLVSPQPSSPRQLQQAAPPPIHTGSSVSQAPAPVAPRSPAASLSLSSTNPAAVQLPSSPAAHLASHGAQVLPSRPTVLLPPAPRAVIQSPAPASIAVASSSTASAGAAAVPVLQSLSTSTTSSVVLQRQHSAPTASVLASSTLAGLSVAVTPPCPPPLSSSPALTASSSAVSSSLKASGNMEAQATACSSASTRSSGSSVAAPLSGIPTRQPKELEDVRMEDTRQGPRPSPSPYSSRGWWEEMAQARAERRGQMNSPRRDSFGSDEG